MRETVMGDGHQVKVTLVGSPIGQTQRQRQTMRGLGLTRVGKSVVMQPTPAILGMIKRVGHLVRVES